MPWLITPGQFARRAALYHQLASLTAAGVGVIQAIEQLYRHPPSASYRPCLRRALDQLNSGSGFAEAMAQAEAQVSAFDHALLEAGEQSGRLDQCFRLLGDYYAERARTTREVLSGLAYPMFVMHFAVFIFPFPQLFLTGDLWAYLRQTFGVLLPVYSGVALLIYAGQGRHGEAWRSLVEQVLRFVPLVGSGRRDLALARLAAALEALLSAGVTVIEAWELAVRASGSPALARTVTGWKRQLAAGETPAETVQHSRAFPSLFATQYATGETSGQLDETLGRLHRYYQDEGARKLQAVAQWLPRFFYLVIAALIAWKVFSFWMGYFERLQSIGGF